MLSFSSTGDLVLVPQVSGFASLAVQLTLGFVCAVVAVVVFLGSFLISSSNFTLAGAPHFLGLAPLAGGLKLAACSSKVLVCFSSVFVLVPVLRFASGLFAVRGFLLPDMLYNA
ncbi:hypothetical protein NQD34_011424 [Periophthalmus magnuspinnatus]|nr:hypothetical protein NQD34_011424 [Periophthalmus magnuspinnatus]